MMIIYILHVQKNFPLQNYKRRNISSCGLCCKCSIEYVESKPLFKVCFGTNFTSEVQSSEFSMDAACKYYQEFKEGSTTKISGSLLFGLKLSSVEKIRLSQHILNVVESEKENTFHKTDKIKLKQVTFQTCNDDVYSVNFGQLDKVKKTKRIEVVVKSLDKGHVSREAYRSIAKIKPNIPREGDVYNI
ncbi:hypothetical protein GLOIN_2v1767849 [Rhizophagus irregularis DAOM 181602=DAOM 197198]|nr:hypothetical protein GLOIN_2v1767849 [Rhizophagus irregularis DAOM 181602=DAOM 197198]